jgi:hypothetical protein
MTPELAKLLDGPVAERFGRAGDGPKGPWFLHLADPCGAWVFRADSDEIETTNSTAEALWLSHLLKVCSIGPVELRTHRDWNSRVVTHTATVDGAWHGEGASHLEALARAMLQSPDWIEKIAATPGMRQRWADAAKTIANHPADCNCGPCQWRR